VKHFRARTPTALLFASIACTLGRANDITPRIGVIEIYGARKVPIEKIKAAFGANAGDPLPSRAGAEERIDRLSGVLASRVEAACCQNKRMVLYIGIQEKDEPHVEYHPSPTGDITLSPDVLDAYHKLLENVAESIRGRNADEDLTNGYSLMADPDCREIQESLLPLAGRDLNVINRVLRESADPEQRAAAAYLLQYGPRNPRASKIIVDSLQYGLLDSDDNVRDNANHALRAVMVGARLHPEQQIRIEPTWYVELMNSVVWSDRRNASLALVNLTDQNNPEALALLRERALPAVVETARWHDLERALPAFILAGRIAGMSDQEINAAWISGNREVVLKKALRTAKRRSKEPAGE
jgi:hypothetical protein